MPSSLSTAYNCNKRCLNELVVLTTSSLRLAISTYSNVTIQGWSQLHYITDSNNRYCVQPEILAGTKFGG